MFGGAVASLIYINSDVTILGIMKGDLEVGYYSVSAKIYTLVKQVMNAAMVVLLPRVSNEVVNGSKEHLNRRFQNVINLLLVFIGPACVGLFILSSNIVSLFSGSDYLPAASSLKILAISLPFATLACFYINVVMVPYRMEKKVLFATGLSAIINIVLNIMLIPYWGQNATAFTTLLAEMLMLSCGIYFTRNEISINVRKGLVSMIIEMIGTVIICIACIHFTTVNLLQILSAVILSCIFCGVIVLVLFKEECKAMFKAR
jgi:O-antigen/teichoic acid export membrane protein